MNIMFTFILFLQTFLVRDVRFTSQPDEIVKFMDMDFKIRIYIKMGSFRPESIKTQTHFLIFHSSYKTKNLFLSQSLSQSLQHRIYSHTLFANSIVVHDFPYVHYESWNLGLLDFRFSLRICCVFKYFKLKYCMLNT